MKELMSAIILLSTILVTTACAESQTGGLVIENAYTRSTPPTAPVAGGFMTITNQGKESDTLLGGKVDFAGVVEVHEMPVVDGVMMMRQLENGLEIPAGETVELKPGGYHLMFIQLSEQMKEGDTHKAVLNFAKGGDMEIELEVRDIGKMMDHSGHGSMSEDKDKHEAMDHSQHNADKKDKQ